MERYEILYIPTAEVEKVHWKHKKAIEQDGASVWDFVRPEELEVSLHVKTEQMALEEAKRVLPLDECGEITVYHQELEARDSGDVWRMLRRADFYEGDDSFDWKDY